MKSQKKVLLIALSCMSSTSAATAGATIIADAAVSMPPLVTPPVVTLPGAPVIAGPACCPTPLPATVAYRPLVAIAPVPCSYEVGRGILGQPKLYVPDQPLRNFFRWISP